MEAMRNSWSDDRLDDLNRRVDAGFGETRMEFQAVRQEMRDEFKAVRAEMRTEFHAVRAEMREGFARIDRRLEQIDTQFDHFNARFDRMQQTLIVVGAGLIGTLLATSGGLI